MRSRATRAATLCALVLGAGAMRLAFAQDRMYRVEEAIETSALRVALPGAGIGSVEARACRECAPRTLLAGTQTRWLLDGQSVTFERMQSALRASPRRFVVLYYRPRTGELTRLVAVAP